MAQVSTHADMMTWGGLGQYNQENAYKIDQLMAQARNRNVHIMLMGETATNGPRHIVFNHPQIPVPYGRIRFQDLTYLPGTLTFDFYGHEVELLPRVLSINLKEYDWQPDTTYYLSATNKIPGLKDRDRKGRR